MSVNLFILGVFAGIAYVGLFGVLEGLFGKNFLFGVFAVFCVIFLGLLFQGAPSETASQMPHWSYFVGVVAGALTGIPPSVKIQESIEVNGEPRYKLWLGRL